MHNFIFVPDPDQLKEQIRKAELLTDAVWRALPAFVAPGAIERMTIESVGEVLMGVRNALRDFLCAELEQKLAEQIAHPLPTQAEMDKMMQPHVIMPGGKPPIEALLRAQSKVAMLEEAIQKIQNLEDSPMREALIAAQVPGYEMMLVSAKEEMSWIQAAMEKADEATASELSNESNGGEATKNQ